MRFLYSIGIHILGIVLKITGLFNTKIKLGVKGRQETFDILTRELHPNVPKLWFHCASLGEYEQGLPVFEALKEKYSNHQIVLSFFSPSGYEIKKDNSIGDVVVYLPLDTPVNARRFLKLVDPELSIFTKYDLWPNFVRELGRSNSRAYLISAIFRSSQSYFKWYGSIMRQALHSFDHIFTQNESSKVLLKSIGILKVSVTGDTRFDRVQKQLQIDNGIAFIETFKQDHRLVVFGSSWPADDALFVPFINKHQHSDLKFLIAPHKISEKYTEQLALQLSNRSVIAYSNTDINDITQLKEAEVFILDTIGFLSKAYSYADIAYVGGAAGKTGLHNILEPAVFGLPVIIGTHYDKFPEAVDLVDLGGVCTVKTSEEFERVLNNWLKNEAERQKAGAINYNYVKDRSGAVKTTMQVIEQAGH